MSTYLGSCCSEGEPGPAGPTGPTGPEGPAGATGPQAPEETSVITPSGSVTLMDFSRVIQYDSMVIITFRALLTLTDSTNFYNGNAITIGSYAANIPAAPTYVTGQVQYTESGTPPTIQSGATCSITTGNRTIQLLRGDGDSTASAPTDPLYISGTIVYAY